MKPIIVANWKCNPQNIKEAKSLLYKTKHPNLIVCPPFIFLSQLKGVLGAQDCFWEQSGAFTGEISPKMLRNLGCLYVIIGHSERRKLFQEDNNMINRKLRASLDEKLIPILCIGETEEEKNQGKTISVLESQLTKALINIKFSYLKSGQLIIAYEPVWAIGTGNACDTDRAMSMAVLVRKIIAKIFKKNITPKSFSLLYGGSVNEENASSYIKEAGYNGLLVGKASLDPKKLNQILKM